jgi:hypothetical protein
VPKKLKLKSDNLNRGKFQYNSSSWLLAVDNLSLSMVSVYCLHYFCCFWASNYCRPVNKASLQTSNKSVMLIIDTNTPFPQNVRKPWPYLSIQLNVVFSFISYRFFLKKNSSCFISVFLLSKYVSSPSSFSLQRSCCPSSPMTMI